jgi:hypothetical protein
MSKSKPYRTSDFLARRADAAQKAAKDAVRAERLARARADIERTLAAARAPTRPRYSVRRSEVASRQVEYFEAQSGDPPSSSTRPLGVFYFTSLARISRNL